MKAHRPHIVPSILSADFGRLTEGVKMIQKAGARSVQVDVMDGHFVPNITVGPVVIEALRRETSVFLDVHLMIENPGDYLDVFADAGADLITVHWEACTKPRDVIRHIKRRGVQAGMAIRPKTRVDVLWNLLPHLDLALVMTVEPGFGGQAFMPGMLEKVRILRERIQQAHLSCQIQVDGGINLTTAPMAVAAGATSLVAGSAVFGASQPAKAFRSLQKIVETCPSSSQ